MASYIVICIAENFVVWLIVADTLDAARLYLKKIFVFFIPSSALKQEGFLWLINVF